MMWFVCRTTYGENLSGLYGRFAGRVEVVRRRNGGNAGHTEILAGWADRTGVARGDRRKRSCWAVGRPRESARCPPDFSGFAAATKTYLPTVEAGAPGDRGAMMRNWRFRDLEFVALWESMHDEALPPPFAFTSRPHPYLDDRQQKHAAATTAWLRVGAGFREVLDVVARPDIWVMVRGFDGRDPDDPKGTLRIMAARRGQQGYVLDQLPGETIDHSGEFTVTECDPSILSEVIVDRLPKVGAGRTSEIVLTPRNWDRDNVDRSADRSLARASADVPGWHRAEEFLRLPVASTGSIEIGKDASRFGLCRRVDITVTWRDVIGDGRYGITEDKPMRAVAADRRRMAALIDRPMATVARSIEEQKRRLR